MAVSRGKVKMSAMQAAVPAVTSCTARLGLGAGLTYPDDESEIILDLSSDVLSKVWSNRVFIDNLITLLSNIIINPICEILGKNLEIQTSLTPRHF